MPSEEITLICNVLKESTISEPIERGVAALLAYHHHNEPVVAEELIEEVSDGALTIFTPLNYPAEAPQLLVKDSARFSEPLLSINETRNFMMNIERLSGEKDKLSGNIANELIKDFQLSTRYPPEERDRISAPELTELVRSLSEKIIIEREKVNSKDEL